MSTELSPVEIATLDRLTTGQLVQFPEAELELEVSRRREVLAALEAEYARILAELPELHAENGARMDAQRTQDAVVADLVRGTLGPAQIGILVNPIWRLENREASEALNERERLQMLVQEKSREIAWRDQRKSTLKNAELPTKRAAVFDAEQALERVRQQREAAARKPKAPPSLANMARRLMGHD